MTAAILAMLGVVPHGTIAWATFSLPGDGDWPMSAINLLVVALLGPGSILLVRRYRAGQWLVMAGALVVMAAAGAVVVGTFGDALVSTDSMEHDVAQLFLLAALVPLACAIITLVLTLTPSTRSWLRRAQK